MKKISLLMAVYHPNREWLVQQLCSLEDQTYPDLELLVADDGPDEPVGEDLFRDCLRRIPFRYEVHKKNLGTSRTFAGLVEQAGGEYVAFCDQDDRWRPEKLARLQQALMRPGVGAAYCGLCVIDEAGKPLADDVRKIRKGDRFLSGHGQAPSLFVKNCIYGCSLLLPALTAKAALPLPEGMAFDHWFSLWAAIWGSLAFVDEPLVEYRLHGDNQSRPLKGIENKADYERERIVTLRRRAESCLERVEHLDTQTRARGRLCAIARETRDWTEVRSRWLRHQWGSFPAFCAGRRISPKAFMFELFLPFMPTPVFRALIRRMGR